MRRLIIALIIPIIMLSYCQHSFADATQMECKLASSVDWSADEWFETEENRAFLTMLFLFEMGTNNTISIDKYSVSDSLVCKNENILSIAICGKNDTLMVFYEPNIPYASYLLMKQYPIEDLQYSLSALYPEVKLNSSEALQQALDLLQTMYNN